MVAIPYALTYTSTLRATVPKLVKCEECGLEYVYLMERVRQGEGTSVLFLDNAGARQRAEEQAQDRLRAALERGCEAVPCPACGRIQDHMVPRARKQYRHWMRVGGLCLFLAAALLFIAGIVVGLADEQARTPTPWPLVLWAAAGACAAAAPALPVARWLLARRHDPNAEDVESRKASGQQRAFTKDDFLKMVQEAKDREAAPPPDDPAPPNKEWWER